MSMFSFERYKRNIALAEVGVEGQKKLLNSKVLVVGAGAIGSTVLANLASLGIGTIGVVDGDVLEESNYNRQYVHKYNHLGMSKVESAAIWVKEYNPDIDVITYNKMIDAGNIDEIISGYDLVIDCLDVYDPKFVLNNASVRNNIPMIFSACLSGYEGRVCTIIPYKTACLRCVLPDSPDNLGAAPEFKKGILCPTTSLLASIQSSEAVKLILNLGKPLSDMGISFNILDMSFKRLKFDKNPNCRICG